MKMIYHFIYRNERPFWERVLVIILEIAQFVIIGLLKTLFELISAIIKIMKNIPKESINGFFVALKETQSGKVILFILGLNFFCIACVLLGLILSFSMTFEYIVQSPFGLQINTLIATLNAIVFKLSLGSQDSISSMTKEVILILTPISLLGVVAEIGGKSLYPKVKSLLTKISTKK